MHHPGDHIRAAGGGAAPQDESQAGAHRHAAEKCPQQGIGAHGADGQYVDEDGEKQRGHKAPESENLPHGAVADQEQRNIQQQGNGTHRPVEQEIQDGCHTGQAAGCDIVGYKKGGIGSGADQAAGQDLQVTESDPAGTEGAEMFSHGFPDAAFHGTAPSSAGTVELYRTSTERR